MKNKYFLAIIFCTLSVQSLVAAELIALQNDLIRSSDPLAQRQKQSLAQLVELEGENTLVQISEYVDKHNNKYYRYQQHYAELPILFKQITVKNNAKGQRKKLGGVKVTGIASDLGFTTKTKLNAKQALNNVQNQNSPLSVNIDTVYQFENVTKAIYIDDNSRARLVYYVRYFSDGLKQAKPAEPRAIVDARTGEIITQWDNLNYLSAGGPGGNEKTGRYVYGEDYPHLTVDNDCRMQTPNVLTYDLNFQTSADTVFQFDCPNNFTREINGAYSPLNDAHFFGGVVFDMFDQWLGEAPLDNPLIMRVHYSNQYENAFYTNGTMTFGDGKDRFYPLVSLDVVAHEVAHGYTAKNSGLIYRGESGGINEAFSDIAGEAAEYFLRKKNDYLVGADIFKEEKGALRYMISPTRDGISIEHYDDYRNGINVHHSSGIFNRAFYFLTTTRGWNTQKAFEIFAHANRVYWGPDTDFTAGACGVLEATQDLGYGINAVIDAFAAVGLECESFEREPPSGSGLFASYSYETNLREVQFQDTSVTLSPQSPIKLRLWFLGDGSYSTKANPVHTYSENGRYLVHLIVLDEAGRVSRAYKTISVDDGSGPPITMQLRAGTFWGILSYVGIYWSKVDAETVDIYKDGELLRSSPALDIGFTDFTEPGNYTYQVCLGGTRICTEEASIEVPEP